MYESEEEDYYEPVRTSNAFSNNYIESQINGDKDKILSVKEYLDMIRQYLSNIINDHKIQGEWKIQLTMEINLISSKYSNETRTIHTTQDNIEIMICNKTDEIIKSLFGSFLQKYQGELEKPMKGSEFAFDSVDLLYYKLHKKTLNRGGSYIDSPEWLKSKKAIINLKNINNDMCFQYTVTVALNHQNNKSNLQRISNIKFFIDQYNWKGRNFPPNKKDWNEFQKNNKAISLNILYVPHNTDEIGHAYESKYNLSRENQVILLMSTDGKK